MSVTYLAITLSTKSLINLGSKFNHVMIQGVYKFNHVMIQGVYKFNHVMIQGVYKFIAVI